MDEVKTLKVDDVNRIFNISESYKLPEKLMQILFDDIQKEHIFNQIIDSGADLNIDFLRDYFQEEHGERDRLKQDFTPDCLTDLVMRLLKNENSCADICSGTGALSIAYYKKNPHAFFHCVEFSSRTIPFLLFNLAIRGIAGQVIHGDALTGEITKIYSLTNCGKYSAVTETKEMIDQQYPCVIMNPPYSMKWKPVEMPCYAEFGQMPKNAADWCFVIQGISKLSKSGTLIALLPHGVLFRGNKEGDIRRKMIEKNLIDAIIGLPSKLFMNTSIPICLLVIKKNKQNNDILIIDASKEFIEQGKQNEMSDDHINKIVDAYHARTKIDRFSSVVSFKEMQDNDFNLNIPRYVDTFIPEPIVPLDISLSELVELDKQIRRCESEIYSMMKQLRGTNLEEDKKLKKSVKLFGELVNNKKDDDAYDLFSKI